MNVQTTKGLVGPRTGASDKEPAKKEGEKPSAPSAAVQPPAPPSAPPRAEGERQGPTPPIILPMNDPSSPKSGQSLIDSASAPPPR
jgi:hypothetical protein